MSDFLRRWRDYFFHGEESPCFFILYATYRGVHPRMMSNHFHLVVETPTANLVAGMKWFLGVYTHRFNLRHRFFGHLFSGARLDC
jgi:hypothetical protein